ncbi:MAG TPA: TonB-dependent receptor plug domain-containing protein [Chryseosolibacter sp.]
MKALITFALACCFSSVLAQEIQLPSDTAKTINQPAFRQQCVQFDRELFIVDGKEINQDQLNAIKPSDIESITVLKDSAAIAPYGDRGKRGVVIIEIAKINKTGIHKKRSTTN